MLLLTPVALAGLVGFTCVLGFTFILPLCSAALLLEGKMVAGLLSVLIWLAWLRFGGAIRGFFLEGFEHASL